MRQLALGVPPRSGVDKMLQWCIDALQKVQNASRENDIVRIGGAYTVTGTLTEVRAIDVDTATDAELRQIVGTLLTDLKRGGAKKK